MIKPGKVRKELRRLRLKDGDVLVVHCKKKITDHSAFARWGRALQGTIKSKGVSIVVTMPGITLETINEAAMNRLGWYRKTQVEPGAEEGSICNRDGCQGIMELEPSQNCTCFRNAPCAACMGRNAVCNECGESAPTGD